MRKVMYCFIILGFPICLKATVYDAYVTGKAYTAGSISQTTQLSFGTVTVGDNISADIQVDPSTGVASIYQCEGTDFNGGTLSGCVNWQTTGGARGVLYLAVPTGSYTITGTTGTCSNSNISWRGLTAYTADNGTVSNSPLSFSWNSSNNPRTLYLGGTVRLIYGSSSDLGFETYTCPYTISVNY